MFKDCNKRTICIWFGLYPTLLTMDCDLIQEVLTSPDMLNKAQPLYKQIDRGLKGGLLASLAPKWQHNRKMINPSFNHKVLLSFLPIFQKSTNVCIAKINAMADDNREHHIIAMIHRIALSLTVETTMGKKMKEGDQVDESLIEKLTYSLKMTAYECFLSYLHLDGLTRFITNSGKSKDYVENFIRELIQQKFNKLKELNENNNNANDTNEKINNDQHVSSPEILDDSILISMKKKPIIFIDQAIQIYQKQQFTIEDIISESNTIVITSFETTANGIFSTLTLLAMHPEVQERLFEEILTVFPEKNFKMDYEHMQQLPYMDRVINETLRLTPSVPLIGRQCTKETKLGPNLTLPKDMQIYISQFDLHRRTDIWGPNALKFDPDHFLPENLANIHPYAYIPFSKGLRNCIGWRYALMAMKSMLAGLVRNFRFTTEMKFEDLQYVNHITLKYLKEPGFKIYHRD